MSITKSVPDPGITTNDNQYSEVQQMPGLVEALAKFPDAFAKIKEIRTLIAPMVKVAEEEANEQEKWNPN